MRAISQRQLGAGQVSFLAGDGWSLQKTPDQKPGVHWSSRAREVALMGGAQLTAPMPSS